MNKLQYVCIFSLVLIVTASILYEVKIAHQQMTPEGFLNPITSSSTAVKPTTNSTEEFKQATTDEGSIFVALGGLVVTTIVVIGLNKDLKKEGSKKEEAKQ